MKATYIRSNLIDQIIVGYLIQIVSKQVIGYEGML
jgi:hypothetical protein